MSALMKNPLPSIYNQRQGIIILAALYTVFALILLIISVGWPTGRVAAEITLGAIGFVGIVWLLRLDNLPRNDQQHQWLLLVVAVSAAFQIGRWLADGGALANRTGDDDQIYVMLAQQMVGLLEGTPTFTFRPPGLPALLATSMWLGGGKSIWVFSLMQRLMLASIPPLLFFILQRRLSTPVAAFASLLFPLTEINEIYPSLALSEISYTFGTVLVITFLIVYLRDQRWYWLLAAGVMLGLRVMLRPPGTLSTVAVAFALLLTLRDWRHLLAAILLTTIPSVVAVLSIMQLNRATTGTAALTDLSGLNIVLHIGRLATPLEESAQKDFFLEYLPEATANDVMSSGADIYIVRHRAALDGPEAAAAYRENSEQLARQIVQTNSALYAEIVARRLYAGVVYPRSEMFPLRWIVEQNTTPNRNYQAPTLDCRAMVAVTPDLFDTICETSAQARAETIYAPLGLRIPEQITTLLQAATVSLHYRFRLLIWPFTWGVVAIPAMLYLVARRHTRFIGLVLAGLFCAEFIPAVLFVPIDTRYQLLYIPMFMIALWFALQHLVSSDGAPESQSEHHSGQPASQ